MRRFLPLFVLLAVACTPAREAVDTLYAGGRIYTATAGDAPEAFVVNGDRIVAVGTRADLRERYEPKATVDLTGRFLMPGFIDAHVHPIQGGMYLSQCELSEITSVEALGEAVKACAAKGDPDEWLIGAGWDLSLFPAANPQASLLDSWVSDRPVFLRGADGHSAWVNSRGLAAANITQETQPPPNGVIERDATGAPSGVVRESAMSLVEAVLRPPSDADRDAGLDRALEMAGANGITGVIDAAASPDELATYRRFAEQSKLTVRVNASLMPDGTSPPAELALNDKDPWLRRDAVKIFADGVLEGETAALLEPYASGKSGALNVPLEQLTALVTTLDAQGAQVHVHAIGDAAVREALDAFEAAKKTNGDRPRRHHIAHLQLIHPDDYPRFAALGVTANFQSLWAFPDSYIVDVNLPQVGQARVDRMYPIGTLTRAGARIVGGSDWPVSSINPLLAIEVAVTRQDPTSNRAGTLNADEKIDLATALAAYTSNAAWLTGRDADLGTIEAGKLADFVILDTDPFAVTPDKLSDIKVVSTTVGGKQVWPR